MVRQQQIVQLVTLRNIYIAELDKYGIPNPDCRSESIKSIIEKHEINKHIGFAHVNSGDKGCISYNLVFRNLTICMVIQSLFYIRKNHLILELHETTVHTNITRWILHRVKIRQASVIFKQLMGDKPS